MLTSTFNTNWAELFNHMRNLWPQTSEPTAGKHGYSYMIWFVWITNTSNTVRILTLYLPCIMFRHFLLVKKWHIQYVKCFSIATILTRTCCKGTFVHAQLVLIVQNFLFSISVHCNFHCHLYWHWRLFTCHPTKSVYVTRTTATNSVEKVSKGNLLNFNFNKGQIVWSNCWLHWVQKLTFAKRVRMWVCGCYLLLSVVW